jgi:UDPglucose 6-dehydrogenase
MSKGISIAVVGSGYVGLVATACFAEIGHRVICVDNDEAKLRILQNGGVPIHEDYLPEVLERHRGHSIEFTSDLRAATQAAQAIFIAVGTPQSSTGSADLSYVDAVASEIARSINEYKVIVEKSTVPVYTNEWIRRVVERNGVPRDLFDVASNPEFLREGTAVVDFLHADRIVVGADTERAGDLLKTIYAPLTSGTYYRSAHAVPGPCGERTPPPVLLTSTKAAEIIKHASNAFLATKISFINVVANICEAAGADVEEVARGMGMDSRIGPKFLRAGVGYGGSCFPKDVAAFRHVAETMGIDFCLLKEVEKIRNGASFRRYAPPSGPSAARKSVSSASPLKAAPTISANPQPSTSLSRCSMRDQPSPPTIRRLPNAPKSPFRQALRCATSTIPTPPRRMRMRSSSSTNGRSSPSST